LPDGIGEQAHPGTQLFEVSGQVTASRWENRPPCRYTARPVSESNATAASSAEDGSSASVSTARSFWARACCSRPSRRPPAGGASGNRVIGPLDRVDKLGAQRDLQGR
jgi:hypothetical protein